MFHAIFRAYLAFGVEVLRLIQLGIRTTVMLIEAVGRQGMFVSYWSGMEELACWVRGDSDVDAQSTTYCPKFLNLQRLHCANLHICNVGTGLSSLTRSPVYRCCYILIRTRFGRVVRPFNCFARLEFNG